MVTSIQANAATALAAAQANPANAATAIQAAVTNSLGGVQSLALTQALSVASKIAGPVCPAVGYAATKAPVDVPTQPDYSIFGPLAKPVKAIDNGASDALYKYYVQAMAVLLAPVNLPPGAEAIAPYVTLAQALLSLLKINWHTEYTTANGADKIIRNTPGFLNLPMVIDSDNNAYVDTCANFGLDLTSGVVTQQVDRVPTANRKLRLDILGQFLGLINVGYETAPSSNMPTMYQTTTSLTQNPVTTNVQQPGANFTQIVGYSLKSNTTSPVTCPASNPSCTKTRTVLDVNLQQRLETVKSPTDYTYSSKTTTVPAVPPATTAVTTSTTQKFVGSNLGTAWSNKTRTTGSLKITSEPASSPPITLINLPLDSIAGIGSNPSPRSVEYCVSTNRGVCANAPASLANVETSSMRILSTPATTFHTFAGLASAPPTVCPSTTETHLNVTKMYLGYAIPTAAAPNGHAWIDTDGLPLSGCHFVATGTSSTYPTGFSANDRSATWSGTTANTPALTKSGTIACPAGTVIRASAAFNATSYLCNLAPLNTLAPSISGDPYQQAVLTASPGNWTPGAPNAPTFAYQWLRCDAAGAACTPISGATGTTYSPTAADLGSTIRIRITATNADGAVVAQSAATPVITTPPAPTNTAPPVITGAGGIIGVGTLLTSTNGAWANSPTGFAYQWLLCDADGNACAPIAGETTNTYTPVAGDMGHQVRIDVTASNLGGENTARSAGVYVLPPPANTTLPVIRLNTSAVNGDNVFQGDTLNTTNGTWSDAQSFAYQWEACDEDGTNCAPLAGKTASTIKLDANELVGKIIGVTVTAINPNGSTSAVAARTGKVLANVVLQSPVNVPDGAVNASADSGSNSAIIGGAFDTVGPLARGAASIDAVPAAASKTTKFAAMVSGGSVKATVSDAVGGYFIGGSFTSVKGQACKAVAHIKNDGTLDTSYCQDASFNGEVRALDYVNRRYTTPGAATSFAGCGASATSTPPSCPVELPLAIGGSFTRGAIKNFFFQDRAGTVSTLNSGDPDGAVNAIANDSGLNRGNFFIGGEFSNLGTIAASRVGLATIATGSAVPQPTPGTALTITSSNYPGGVSCTSCANAVVNTVALGTGVNVVSPFVHTHIFVGGVFDTVQATTASGTPTPRRNAAVFTAHAVGSQAVGAWDPNPNGEIKSIAAVTGNSNIPVYLAGEFTTLGAAPAPSTGYKGLGVWGLLSHTGSAWTAGNNTSGTAASSAPNTVWRPQIDNGRVNGMVVDTAGVYLGGSFTSVNGLVRHRLAQVSLPSAAAVSTGAWDPNAGRAVNAIAKFTATSPAVSQIFAGGDYQVIGGVTRDNVAELKPDGSVTGWAPAGTNGPVNAVLVKAGIAYVGGAFSAAGAAARGHGAAFTLATGSTTAWNPSADGAIKALANSPSGVYAGGAFTTVGADTRKGLADLDGASGAASGFDADVVGTVNAIAFDSANSVVYIGGLFNNVAGSPRSNLAALSAGGALQAFNPGSNGAVNAVAVNGDGVFAGGAFSTLGGASRNNIGLVSLTGSPVAAFNPDADGAVRALRLLGSKLYVGGVFSNIGGLSRANAAQLNADLGSDTPGAALGAFDPAVNGAVNTIMTTPSGILAIFGLFDLIGTPAQQTQSVGFYL